MFIDIDYRSPLGGQCRSGDSLLCNAVISPQFLTGRAQGLPKKVRVLFSPSSVVSVFVGGRAVPNPVVGTVVGFVILFLLSWVLGSLVLTLGGTDMVTAASASIATLGNVGPGLGAVGPKLNYSIFGTGEKIVLVLLTLLGRLEVYAIAALFLTRFWRR